MLGTHLHQPYAHPYPPHHQNPRRPLQQLPHPPQHPHGLVVVIVNKHRSSLCARGSNSVAVTQSFFACKHFRGHHVKHCGVLKHEYSIQK